MSGILLLIFHQFQRVIAFIFFIFIFSILAIHIILNASLIYHYWLGLYISSFSFAFFTVSNALIVHIFLNNFHIVWKTMVAFDQIIFLFSYIKYFFALSVIFIVLFYLVITYAIFLAPLFFNLLIFIAIAFILLTSFFLPLLLASSVPISFSFFLVLLLGII